MKIGIIGLGNIFNKQLVALKKVDGFEISALCDTDKNRLNEVDLNIYKTTDYKNLKNHCEAVIILTPSDTHLKISEFFIKNNISIILEKPIAINSEELNEFCNILQGYDKFYNLLHFSFGDEILYFKDNLLSLGLPKKISASIFDDYIENNKIKPEVYSHCGAYLDETINPLSAIVKLFGSATFMGLTQKTFEGDVYDYYSKAIFKIKDCEIEIMSDWSQKKSDKYIDLIYCDKTIRLNSVNQSIENISTGEILFKANGDRMTNHYANMFKDFLQVKTNKDLSINLHQELLNNL